MTCPLLRQLATGTGCHRCSTARKGLRAALPACWSSIHRLAVTRLLARQVLNSIADFDEHRVAEMVASLKQRISTLSRDEAGIVAVLLDEHVRGAPDVDVVDESLRSSERSLVLNAAAFRAPDYAVQ
jgi:hypothetical protein